MKNRKNLIIYIDWSPTNPKPAGPWSCDKCHWQNPAIRKNCGKCRKRRKEKP